MKKFSQIFVIFYCFCFFWYQEIFAGTVVDKFKIEGIRTIASTKALPSELPKKLDIKILDLNLKNYLNLLNNKFISNLVFWFLF